MRHILIPLLMAAGVSACDGENAVRITTTTSSSDDKMGVLKVVDGLQCPQTVRTLTRKGSADPGGATCTYGGPRGSEVVLHLVKLDGRSAEQVLKDFETRVSADMPQAAAQRSARSVSGPKGRAAEARFSAADIRCIAYSFRIETILAMGPR